MEKKVTKKVAKVAAKAPAAEEPKKETAVQTPVKAAAAKPTAVRKAAAKEPAAEKKAPAKTSAAEKKTTRKTTKAVTATVSVQFAGKDYSQEALVQIAKDVWQYDLGKAPEDFKAVELFVKPEESRVYYIINGNEMGSFLI